MALGGGKRVLMVGGEGVTLFGPTVRGIERETAISWEMPNFDQQLIDALTQRNENAPVVILFDGADQTYRKEENIPKLSPFDRIRYVKRKLDLAFPSYPVRASILVKPGRLKDSTALQDPPFYLFVALPETERLDKIGGDLLEAGVPVSGFGLLPAESVGLVKALSEKLFTPKNPGRSHWSILLAQHETGGLRQVVVKNGNLALTRLTPTSEAGVSGPAWVEDVTREFKATLTYIARFGYNAEENLDVVILCSALDKQFFDAKNLNITNLKCLTTQEALHTIGIKSASVGSGNFGDALHAAWAARKARLTAPVIVPSINKIMIPRLGARMAAGALVLALLGLTFLSFREYQDYRAVQEEVSRKQSQLALLEQEYTQESKIFDALPVKPEAIRGALAVSNYIGSSRVNITPTLHVLRKTLDTDIKLESLSFDHSAPILQTKGGQSGTPAPASDPAAGASDRGIVKIDFKFTLPPSVALEQKVIRAEQLAERLRQAFAGYDVKIVQQFGGVSRLGKFTGETGKTPPPGSAAITAEMAEIQMQGAPL